MARATVLIPTFDNGAVLALALGSARGQTVEDLDIVVVGDGTTDEARSMVRDAMAEDPRVRFVDRPKGERHGERHRHEALADATGEVVCYLSDDDVWLPHHVEVVVDLLTGRPGADVGSTGTLLVGGDGQLNTWLIDLADEDDRDRVVHRHHDLCLSAMAHTLDAYRRLPEGWRPAPTGFNSDHWMTRQLLGSPGTRAATSAEITVVHPPTSFWRERAEADKVEATRWYAAAVADEAWRRDEWPAHVLRAHRYGWAQARAREDRYRIQLERVTSTRWWRAREAAARGAKAGRAAVARRRGQAGGG